MKYETRVTALVVLPVGQPTFSEMATTVEIADEAAGEFVEVKQRGRIDIGKIQINPEEWPALRDAIDRLIAEIMDERGKQYDSPHGERSMGRCVVAFNALTGRDLEEAEGWLFQQLLKDARQWSGGKSQEKTRRYHRDSAEDCIAYAALCKGRFE